MQQRMPPPDAGFSAGLRLGCGGLLGLLLGAVCALGLATEDAPKLVLVTVLAAVFGALLSWRFGDRFWRWIGEALSYLPWW